eukprot:scaffold24003_cov90-Isochrysis_galbana.AAC.3
MGPQQASHSTRRKGVAGKRRAALCVHMTRGPGDEGGVGVDRPAAVECQQAGRPPRWMVPCGTACALRNDSGAGCAASRVGQQEGAVPPGEEGRRRGC